MQTIYSESHHLYVSPGEFGFGEFVSAFEKLERADIILARVRAVGIGAILPPASFPFDRITSVHAPSFVSFLQTAHAEWAALGRKGAAYPILWAGGGMRRDRFGGSIDTKLARFCLDAATPIGSRTWEAVEASANCALTAASLIANGEKSAFALCRPPGHHAGIDHYGGYCFLNNRCYCDAVFARFRSPKKSRLSTSIIITEMARRTFSTAAGTFSMPRYMQTQISIIPFFSGMRMKLA